jgi:putative lipoic acid-binding regulatory protein
LRQTLQQSDSFYSRFYEQLLNSQSWPGIYLFKFIVKAESGHLDILKSFFETHKPTYTEKHSSKNKFTSLSVKVTMESPDKVIQIYKKVDQLEGVITL